MKTILLDLFGPGTWGTGGNLVASAILGACAAVAAFLGRHKIGRTLGGWWGRHHPNNEALEEIRRTAEAAHRISAATHERLTGERHPDSPPKKEAP